MAYDPRKHRRRSIRLKNYDYSSPGAYFVTACLRRRVNGIGTLGNIRKGIMWQNDAGRIVDDTWFYLPERFLQIVLDAYVVMPDHFHGIVWILDPPDAPLAGPDSSVGPDLSVGPIHESAQREDPAQRRRMILPLVMGYFKMNSAKQINRIWHRKGALWQEDYYETVIRSSRHLDNVRRYIKDNPMNWKSGDKRWQ